MTSHDLLQIVLFFGLGLALTVPLGRFMARLFQGERTFLHPVLGPVERLVYRLTSVDPAEEMSWTAYLAALVLFNLLGLLSLWGLQLAQAWLPLNPQHLPSVPWALALNTAISFTTNTNWQAYSGESTLSYLTQMAGLGVHNFTSAATGIAVLLVLARGLSRSSTRLLGNFWADLTRATLYVLLPLSLALAVALMGQGVVQSIRPYATASLVEPYTTQVQKTDDKGNAVNGPDGKPVMVDQRVETQSIPAGPAASQIAIKQLGTNGGGFFGQNSAHPFENSTPLSNFLEMFSILLIPAGLIWMFGDLVRQHRHARVILGVMLALFAASFALAWRSETRTNPVLGPVGALMEGKETRFGVMNSVLWGTATTGTSNGSVNAMHDSLTPLAGFVTLGNLMLGCIVFGGIGVGLTGFLMHVLLTVFIAGLMIGRTPEYLGKKIQLREATWAIVAVLVPSAVILGGAAFACGLPAGLSSLNNQGPHGFSEILYAFSSCAANNGSAFAGLNANTPFYNLILGAAMLLGRFVPILAVLAIAGGFAAKKTVPASAGTLPTHGLTFACALLGVIVIVTALTFFPALCLGPLVENGLMRAGRTF
ncbi:MAG TPA: potassium-transporting ATPase subunit KdpA [Opitutaceae bacterium]|jgi:K+-transporting ATPase ATPase A chain|nr:potassium-transporting ATPase subunit KdpA [Opitutaceae bacterium]